MPAPAPPPPPPLHLSHPALAADTDAWLARRGRAPLPRLSPSDLARARAVFSLMDRDGSGAVDGAELGEALELLGVRLPPAALAALVASVDADASGVLEFREFVGVLARALGQQGSGGSGCGGGAAAAASAATGGGATLPFALAFGAYRRRRLLAALKAGDRVAVASLAAQVGDGGLEEGGKPPVRGRAPPPQRAPAAAAPPPPPSPPPAVTPDTWRMRPRPRCF